MNLRDNIVDLRLAAVHRRDHRREKYVALLKRVDPTFDPNIPYWPGSCFDVSAGFRSIDVEQYHKYKRSYRVRKAVSLAMLRRRDAGESFRSLSERYGLKIYKVKLRLAQARRRRAEEANYQKMEAAKAGPEWID